MKLFPKIIGIGVVGILVAAVVAGITTYCGMLITAIQNDEYRYRIFRNEITAARLAHLSWLRTINEAILAEKETLNVGTDGHQCNFGKWYYSEETKAVVKTKPKTLQDAFWRIENDHLKIHDLGGELVKLWNKEDLGPCIELYNDKIAPMATNLLSDMLVIEDSCTREIEEVHKRGEWILKNQTTPTEIAMFLGVLVIIPYAWLTARGIVKPLQVGKDALRVIAEKGNIQMDIPADLLKRRDEIGELSQCIEQVLKDYRAIAETTGKLAEGDWHIMVREKSSEDTVNQSFSKMLDQVNSTLHQINDNVKQVATGSGEVSNAAQNLSNGAQEAAASLEEITASMSEISSQTKANAESATQARDLARKASLAATKGQEAMLEMTGAMERITKNSTEIQRVIKVIDDIAFQTNLLALNAAVEAARAGQHGKGFAVVAEEVRNLASRSAKAAQETSELIAKSGQEIEKGDEVASHTAEVLNTIVDQIKQTTDLVAGIAVASSEQAEGVNQVTIGLQQIDAVTQQNTSSAEESASAANEMSGVATNLQSLVGQFKLR